MDNNILETIKNKQIQMKPRWHFILQAVLMMAIVLMMLFIAIYLISFIVFVAPRSGSLIAFWLLILLATIFIYMLELFVQRYSIAYRRPLLYSTIAILLFILLSVIIADRIRFHDRFERFVERRHVPGIPRFYRVFPAHMRD